MKVRLCKLCGVQVGKGKSFCLECKKKKARARVYPTTRQTYESRQCPQCSAAFTPIAPHQVRCSIKCRRASAADTQRKKGATKTQSARWRAANKERLAAARKAKRREPGVLFYRQWYAAVKTHKSYTGTLEEYAYYRERAAIRAHGNKKMAEANSEAHKKAIESNPAYGMSVREAYKYWYHNDPAFRAWERQRNQFKKWFRGDRRSNTLARMLGYTRQQLVAHLEAQFRKGMTWDNMGEWHIDHIKPKNLFDPTSPDDVVECWSLSNLRPLWASENCGRPKDGSDVLL